MIFKEDFKPTKVYNKLVNDEMKSYNESDSENDSNGNN